jgi:hypothetical protein
LVALEGTYVRRHLHRGWDTTDGSPLQPNASGDSATPEAAQSVDGAAPGNNPNAEAAKYRTRLRETEAERDALVQRVELLQRTELERVAGAHLASPADLLTLSGNALADYLTESGDIDPDKVHFDAQVILSERPGLRPNAPAYDPTQGTGSNPGKQAPTFADLLKD